MTWEQVLSLYDNGWVRYAIVAGLTLILYKLGFERPLPLLKRLIVYIVLVIGSFPLVVLLAFGLPIIPALLAAIVLMVVVRFRERRYKAVDQPKEGNNTNEA